MSSTASSDIISYDRKQRAQNPTNKRENRAAACLEAIKVTQKEKEQTSHFLMRRHLQKE
jgi:hypothetical protein